MQDIVTVRNITDPNFLCQKCLLHTHQFRGDFYFIEAHPVNNITDPNFICLRNVITFPSTHVRFLLYGSTPNEQHHKSKFHLCQKNLLHTHQLR